VDFSIYECKYLQTFPHAHLNMFVLRIFNKRWKAADLSKQII